MIISVYIRHTCLIFFCNLYTECLSLSKVSAGCDSCGPEYGRCNKNLHPNKVYCNRYNGCCGTSKDHRDMQIDEDKYDWEPMDCQGRESTMFY